MKRKTKILLILSLIILISVSCFGIIALKSKGESHQQANFGEEGNNPKVALLKDVQKNQEDNKAKVEKTNQHEELINISECSEEFMEEYFEEVKEIEDKENVLIVSSKEKIENTYGATKIIEAPNNQYILQYESAEKKDKAFQEIKKDTSILSVEENIIYETCETEYNSWGIEKMSLDYATKSSKIEILSDVTVAIIDTGCDTRLFNKYYSGRILETYNVLEDSTASSSMVDEDGHGTHIAGTIAEATPLNVKILPIKVSRDGKMYNTDIITAINYITYNNKADVINMSFGSYYYSDAIEQAINAASNKNIICVAAAGNKNTSDNHYPSALDNTISIASVNSNLTKSGFSNYGSSITFTAPGTNIKSIMGRDTSISRDNIRNGYDDGDDDHETISGTSMATPHAVSAVAILKSYNKNLTSHDVIDLLKKTAVDLGDEGWDEKFGFGLISFKDVQFREDDINTDEYRVYKNINKAITNIELMELKFTPYNYYSLTNIMASRIKVHYINNTCEEMLLWELPNLEVLGYIPTEENEQTITIKTGNISTIVNITNPSNYESGWEYSLINQLEVKITGYKSHELNIGRLYIPEKIDSKDVKEFEDNIQLSKLGNDFSIYNYLYLPSNFTRIGDYSLSNTNIKYVYGNSSEVEVGNNGFESSSIVIVDVPIIEVGDYAFKDCFELIRIDIPGKFAYNSASETSISETSIGEYAFYNCKKLNQIKQSKNYDTVFAEKIGKYAFYNCISLAELEMEPNHYIGEYAFYNCYTLTNIDIYNADSIGIYAFYSSGISEAKLGLINEVKESSFENCRNLKFVSFTSGSIDNRAFWNSAVEEVSIGSMVDYIAEDAFAYCPIKTSHGGSSEGKYYCMPSDGIIENATNKLIVGFKGTSSGNTEIPNFVTEIGNYAFTGNNTVKNVIIPESVTKIGEYAFKDCYQLSSVYMLGDNIEFGDDTFTRTNEGEIKNRELFIYVHKDASNIRKYITSKNLEYRNIEPDEIIVIDNKKAYRAFDKVDEDSLVVKLIYHEENNREEILPKMDENIKTVLTNTYGVGFQCSSGIINYGDSYYTLHIRNIHGYEEQQKKVEIEVLKAIPKYDVPTNIEAIAGQILAQIQLPNGFEWMDETQIIQGLGNVKYKAKYIPTDTINYEIVENIDIIINVKYVIPQSIILDKTNLVFNILEKQKLTATILPEDAIDKNVIWKSTDTNVAQVNSNGEVQPINDGTCEIICMAEANQEIQARCTVVVDNTLQETINKTYNEDNTVTVKVVSKYPFEDTKPTWKLSEDRKIYEKTYNINGTYTTPFTDELGRTELLTFTIHEIDDKAPKLSTNMKYDDETNTVTVEVTSDEILGDTKPTWKLSEDRKTYEKTYNTNGTYTTPFQDRYGNVAQLTFEVNQIQSKYVIEKEYDVTTNTVKVSVINNFGMQHTKPTWNLSADTKIYTKTYTANGIYTTPFTDIQGIVTPVTITIEEIDNKAPNLEINMNYDSETNTVTVEVTSDEILGDTKPTWKLSEDRKTYEKTYNTNGTYTTPFQDRYGNVAQLTFEVNQIQSKYVIEKEYDVTTNTVKVSVINNFGMQHTKSTWNLSADTKIYTKTYTANGIYTTPFTDIQGIVTPVTIAIEEIDNKAPNLEINMNYDSETNTVKVVVTSDEILGDTKPTWKLSEDRKTYEKTYNTNGTYTTPFQDRYGNVEQLTFEVNQIQSKYVIEKEYDVTTNTVKVSVINNFGMQHTKPTWNLSADTKVYTKTYTANGIYTTPFTDEQGVATPITFIIEEIQ